METVDSIGFLRYEGKMVEGGLLDAKSAARALNGFDFSLRYFISVQRPALADIDLPIPTNTGVETLPAIGKKVSASQ
jgi:hypothetical protein